MSGFPYCLYHVHGYEDTHVRVCYSNDGQMVLVMHQEMQQSSNKRHGRRRVLASQRACNQRRCQNIQKNGNVLYT